MTKTETKWRTNERIATLPGATVYIDPQGGMTITGGVDITSTRSGESAVVTDSSKKQESCPPPPDYTLSGGAMIGLDGVTSYGGIVGRRMLGPVWVNVGCFFPPVRAVATVGVTF